MSAPGATEPKSIGRYELTSRLGAGGFATVYRAFDPALDAEVAIKLLLPQFADDTDIRDRFLQEARLLRRVDSPHLVRVYDLGELDSQGQVSKPDPPADGAAAMDGAVGLGAARHPFFVMELADGGVLTDRLRGPVDRGSLRIVVDALAAGLNALHEARIVHRDIKPDNLLIAGRPKVETTSIGNSLLADGERLLIGDLGLAKDHDRTSAGPTIAGGTPFYRAPEQMAFGEPITPAADIYAATAVIWFLLSGEHPPECEAVPALLTAMPQVWQGLLERGLAADPMTRHGTILEWAAEARTAIESGPETGFGSISVGDAANLCPYKGMAAFQPEDEGLYFGRDALVDSLVGRIQAHPVLVIGGPSGSGKSSLMRAGLIPRLQRGAIATSQQWRVALFTPGSDAVGELVHQVGRLRSTEPEPTRPAGGLPLTTGVLGRDDLPHGARRWLDDGPPTLIAIDQFEELFTLNPQRAEQELFLSTLAAMTESAHSRIKIVLALRADFYGICAAFPWLNERINESQILVGPMSRQELRDAVVLPARRSGLQLEDGLADTILDDVGAGSAAGGGSLPLLGHALMETWMRRRGSTMTLEGYQAAGGVAGAIAQRAEEVFTHLDATEQVAARHLLLRMINPGQGTPDTRRRVIRNSLVGVDDSPEVTEKLAAARLLTVDDEAVEVAHEALIQSWPRLRSWIDDNRESLQTRRRIGIAASDWIAQQRSDDLLYRGTQLAGALEWFAAHPRELDAESEAFLSTARDVRDAAEKEQAQRQARAQRNRRRAITALAGLTIAALVSSVVAFAALGRSRANQQAAEAQQVQALAAAAAANASDQPLLATGLAVESIARANPSTAAARSALVQARVGLDRNRLLPQPFGDPVNVGDMQAVAITRDGASFVTGGRGGEVVFWDLTTRTETRRYDNAHVSGVKKIVMSNDGRWMVSVGGWQARLWDLATESDEPRLLHEIERTRGTLWHASFSSDDERIALATEGLGVMIFDRRSGDLVSTGLADSPYDILSIAFLDDQRVVAGDGPGNLHILDVATGQSIVEPIQGGDDGNDIWEVALGRDSTMLTSVSTDYTIKSWRVEPDGLTLVSTLDEPAVRNPTGLLWTRDGEELLVGAADGRLYRSDPMSGELIPGGVSAAVHTDQIAGSDASDNGWLVSLADDQRVQVWRQISSSARVDYLISEGDPVGDLALSPSGKLLAAAGVGGARIVDTDSGTANRVLPGDLTSVAFLTDDIVATGGRDGGVQLWDAGSGAKLHEQRGHGGSEVWAMAASPDGRHLATGANDGSVILWDGTSLERLRDLEGHGEQTTDVAFTNDGRWTITVGFDRLMRFHPVAGGSARVVELAQDGPQTVSVHPDTELVAVGGSQERIDIVDFDGHVVRSMAPHAGGVWDTAITADGLSIVGTSRLSGEVQFWDWETGERLGPAFGLTHERQEPDVVVGDTGVVWSSGSDGNVRQLDVLDQDVGCEISRNVMNDRMRGEFLSGASLLSCAE